MAGPLSGGEWHCMTPDNNAANVNYLLQGGGRGRPGRDFNSERSEQSEQYARYVGRIESISGGRWVIPSSFHIDFHLKKTKKKISATVMSVGGPIRSYRAGSIGSFVWIIEIATSVFTVVRWLRSFNDDSYNEAICDINFLHIICIMMHI